LVILIPSLIFARLILSRLLHDRVPKLDFSADEIANGLRGLLDEVATGKITGEEEYWSRTDLWDFQANIEGARVAFEGLRPLLQERDPDLESQIAAKFATVQAMLDAEREGDEFAAHRLGPLRHPAGNR
jgi:iron uptake system component EfeO